MTTESNTLLGIKKRSLVVHALDISPTTDALLHSDFTKRAVTVLGLEVLHLGLLGGDLSGKSFLQRLGGHGATRRLSH